MAIQVHVNISIVAWGVTVLSTMRLVKGTVSVWITANHTINLCVVQMGSCTRTIVSSTGPLVSKDTELPSCTVRSAFTKVRAQSFSNVGRVWCSGYCMSCTIPLAIYVRSWLPCNFGIQSDCVNLLLWRSLKIFRYKQLLRCTYCGQCSWFW